MTNIIRHQGVIDAIEGAHIQVKIIQTSACSACSLKGHCSSTESKLKMVDVYRYDTSSFTVGDAVTVIATTSMGMQAVLLAFAVPFILIIIALFIAMRVTDGNELVAAGAGLFVLVPYYLVLYLNRDRLSRKFTFDIE